MTDLSITQRPFGSHGGTFEVIHEKGSGELARVIVRPGEDGRLRVRVSVPFELRDAGSVVVVHEDGRREIAYYAGKPNPGWPTHSGDSGLIIRFKHALSQVMQEHRAMRPPADSLIEFRFLDHEGLPWGQQEEPVQARWLDVWQRGAMVDRAMRLQRLESRKRGVPCEYPNLKRVAAYFELAPVG